MQMRFIMGWNPFWNFHGIFIKWIDANIYAKIFYFSLASKRRMKSILNLDNWEPVTFNLSNKQKNQSHLINGSWRWKSHLLGQTVNPAVNFILLNLFKIPLIVTLAWIFLTSMVMEAVRGQKDYSKRTILHSNSMFGSSHSTISWFIVLYNVRKYVKNEKIFHESANG